MHNHKKTTLAASLLYLFSTTAAYASADVSDKFQFDLNRDKEGNINPELFIPVSWNQNWYSGLGFKDRTVLSQSRLDGFDDSKFGTMIDENTTNLNLISYKAGNKQFDYSIGADYQQTSINKTEFGYFHLNNGTIDDYVAFDNTIKIEVSGFSLRGDATWGSSTGSNHLRISALLSPSSTMNVNQNTAFKPIAPTDGIGNSSKAQAFNYLLKVESRHELGSLVTLGFDLQYETLPIKYDLLALSATADNFQRVMIDTKETTTRIGSRLIFNYPLVDGLYPVLGAIKEKITTTDNLSGKSGSQSQTLVLLGFTGQF